MGNVYTCYCYSCGMKWNHEEFPQTCCSHPAHIRKAFCAGLKGNYEFIPDNEEDDPDYEDAFYQESGIS